MSLATELVAGGFAGAVGIMATQPLDTIRIRLQSTSCALGRVQPYAGIADCAKSMLQHEGIRGLWKGYASPTFTVGGMNAVQFLTFEAVLRYLRDPTKDPNEQDLRRIFLAGCVAGTHCAMINGPTELVKCLAQTNLTNKGTLMEEVHIARQLVREHGLFGARGPWRGLMTTILRDTPSTGLYFLVYESITRKLGKSNASSFVAGGCAGASAWACVYPIDVIKTRWTTAAVGVYSSPLHCLRTTMQQGGWRAFLSGFGATMARAWPQHAVVFCTYEGIKSSLNA